MASTTHFRCLFLLFVLLAQPAWSQSEVPDWELDQGPDEDGATLYVAAGPWATFETPPRLNLAPLHGRVVYVCGAGYPELPDETFTAAGLELASHDHVTGEITEVNDPMQFTYDDIRDDYRLVSAQAEWDGYVTTSGQMAQSGTEAMLMFAVEDDVPMWWDAVDRMTKHDKFRLTLPWGRSDSVSLSLDLSHADEALAAVDSACENYTPTWTIADSEPDPFTDVVYTAAHSAEVHATGLSLTEQITGTLGYICDGRLVAGFSFQPDLTNAEYQGEGYSDAQVQVRFDDNLYTTTISIEDGTDLLVFREAEALADLIRSHSEMRLALSWREQGQVVFRWDLTGAGAAMQAAKTACLSRGVIAR